MSTQKANRHVATYRIKKDRHQRFKDVCLRHKLSHCVITEVLIEKFIRGEIILVQKDFDV